MANTWRMFDRSLAIHHLQETYTTNDQVGLAYVFCKYTTRQTATELVKCLLYQLTAPSDKEFPRLLALQETHGRTKTVPSLAEYMAVLKAVIASFAQGFIVVDAIDEMADDSQTRNLFISNILNLASEEKAKVLVMSRKIQAI